MNTPVNTVFKVSPRALLLKVLGRQPGVDHYTISNADKTINGSATIQRFPRVDIAGRDAVPLLTHSVVYPLARGGQFASMSSYAYWFDVATGALIGSCCYSNNKVGIDMNMGMGPWDWIMTDPQELALPMEPVTLDFAKQDISYNGAWAPCELAMGSMGGTGDGSAYDQGPAYTLPGVTVDRKVSVETGRGQGQVALRYLTRTRMPGQAEVPPDNLCLWINTGQNFIQGVTVDRDVVKVNADGTHEWVKRETRWTRVA